MRWFGASFCVLAFAGCGRLFGLDAPVLDEPDAAGLADDAPSNTDSTANTLCYGAGTFELCLDTAPTSSETLMGTLDTDADPRCLATQPAGWAMAGQPPSCIVTATTLTVLTVEATGTRPLVLIATAIDVNGILDASSHTRIKAGAGANSSACTSFARTPNSNADGAGGGAGASFGRAGGAGGAGDSGVEQGGLTNPTSMSSAVLRGGCAGQDGGDGQGTHGLGGYGGGAVYLAASSSITIGGIIAASGGGGVAATANFKRGGGGGGGSGGMIVLAAPSITATGAIVVANGGGGSSGADDNTGMTDGGDPDPSQPQVPASGGLGPNNAGNGGSGFARGSPAGIGTNGNGLRGGGGGGGGGGLIVSSSPLTGAMQSPL